MFKKGDLARDTRDGQIVMILKEDESGFCYVMFLTEWKSFKAGQRDSLITRYLSKIRSNKRKNQQ